MYLCFHHLHFCSFIRQISVVFLLFRYSLHFYWIYTCFVSQWKWFLNAWNTIKYPHHKKNYCGLKIFVDYTSKWGTKFNAVTTENLLLRNKKPKSKFACAPREYVCWGFNAQQHTELLFRMHRRCCRLCRWRCGRRNSMIRVSFIFIRRRASTTV